MGAVAACRPGVVPNSKAAGRGRWSAGARRADFSGRRGTGLVICSPATPQSEWVNAEVKRFRAMGRDDRILAVLTEGDPRTSFPPTLYEIREGVFETQQPLAADVRRSHGEAARTLRQRAVWRLAATMVGCRFDDLRQREQERQIRRLIAA